MRTIAKLLHQPQAYRVVYLTDILIHTQGTDAAYRDALTGVSAAT
jgi:hypothetical protein